MPQATRAPFRLALLAAAALLALPGAASAQSNEELLRELRELRARVQQLEQRVAQQPAAPAPAQPGQWGMTPEQSRELARVTVKTEALQDNFADQGFKGLKISGQMDPTYIFNRRSGESGFVFLNNGGVRYTYDNSYFGMVVLDFAKETESGARWKLTLAPERGTGALFNGSIVHEASVSIPLSDAQTRLWVGQIPDWTGYELTLPEGNKLITHNLLFDTMAPTAYTGAVFDLTMGKWWVRGGVANVNSARTSSGNRGSALIYRVDYSRGEFQGFGFTGLHGKVANFAADGQWDSDGDGIADSGFAGAGRNTMAHLLEFDAYFIRGDWSLFGQVSYGQQKNSAIYNSDGKLRNARWWGLSGLAAYAITPRLEAIARLDYVNNEKNGGGLFGYSFDDPLNGIGRGFNADGTLAGAADKGSNRWALALGMNYRYSEDVRFKVEYRLDRASLPVFGDFRNGAPAAFYRNNHLLGTSMVLSF